MYPFFYVFFAPRILIQLYNRNQRNARETGVS